MQEICSTIVAIVQENRTETATKVQDILTNYGCHIGVRLGLHDARVDQCTDNGLILLQMCADQKIVSEFEQEMQNIPHVRVKSMSIQ